MLNRKNVSLRHTSTSMPWFLTLIGLSVFVWEVPPIVYAIKLEQWLAVFCIPILYKPAIHQLVYKGIEKTNRTDLRIISIYMTLVDVPQISVFMCLS